MESWGYLSGSLRAERVHLLSDAFFASLAETTDEQALAKALEDTVYGYLFQGHNLKDFTKVFDEYFSKKMLIIKEIAPCPLLVDLYALKTDLNNLKLLYKAKQNHKEVVWESLSESGTIAPERMFTIVENELYNELPSTVMEALLELSQKQGDTRRVDFLIDKAYYSYRLFLLKKEAEHPYYNLLYAFYRKEIDCENIKNLLRAKRLNMEKSLIADLLIPGGFVVPAVYLEQDNLSVEDLIEFIKDGSYGAVLQAGLNNWLHSKSGSLLEKQIDEYLIHQVKSFSYVMEGPAVAEEALRSLSLELKNLKLIIIGKLNAMSVESIKARVRHVG